MKHEYEQAFLEWCKKNFPDQIWNRTQDQVDQWLEQWQKEHCKTTIDEVTAPMNDAKELDKWKCECGETYTFEEFIHDGGYINVPSYDVYSSGVLDIDGATSLGIYCSHCGYKLNPLQEVQVIHWNEQ